MAWNEPGGDKDSWGGNSGNQGPPDIDEMVKKLQDKLGGIFGGGGGRSPSGGAGGGDSFSGPSSVAIGLLIGVLAVIWLGTGIYIIEPAERGVILRFGAYKEVTQPGPHWHIPYPVENVVKLNVDQFSSFRHKAQMLTRDENIVDIELTVQSRIQDAADYLFQDQNPDKTMRDATETAVRQTIGKSDLDFILTEGRASIADTIRTRVQSLLDNYRTGLEVTSVNMQPAKPPEQVKSAFDDAIKAREDKARQENQAEAYANEVVPKARGAGARQVAGASAYREKVIAEAEGETSRFLAVLTEYEKATEVTRQRLYLDTVEDVLKNSNKVILDVKSGNSLMYLPLDKLIQSSGDRTRAPLSSSTAQSLRTPTVTNERESGRSRRVR